MAEGTHSETFYTCSMCSFAQEVLTVSLPTYARVTGAILGLMCIASRAFGPTPSGIRIANIFSVAARSCHVAM